MFQAKAVASSPPELVPQPQLRTKAAEGEDPLVPRMPAHVRAQGQSDPPLGCPRPRVWPPGACAGPQDRTPEEGAVYRWKADEGEYFSRDLAVWAYLNYNLRFK